MEKTKLAEDIYLVKNFLSKTECEAFIRHSEEIGYEEATVTTNEGQKMIKSIRNNQRVLIKNLELAFDPTSFLNLVNFRLKITINVYR